MDTLTTIAELRARVQGWRTAGERIAFVPTMGNLHRGHIALVERARVRASKVVVSIFVNPLQFGPGEDFQAYPRTEADDVRQLREAEADVLFLPTVTEMYPHGQQGMTRVEVPGLSDILCGAARPGHFVGVATVVTKLFNIVQPDSALFGAKDFQQLLVIRRLTLDLNLPIEIIGIPTVREPDGLAMSSRNQYLGPAERPRAASLSQVLRAVADDLQAGRRDFAALELAAGARLLAAGLRPDYVSIRRSADLMPPLPDDTGLVVLAAAWLGKARLIDNICMDCASKNAMS